MKRLIPLFLFFLIFYSCDKCTECTCNYKVSLNETLGEKYVCGQVFIRNKAGNIGSILIASSHENSYEVFFDDQSFDEDKIKKNKLTKGRKVCFQIENLRGISFAKNMVLEKESEGLDIITSTVKTSVDLHDRKDHKYSSSAHTKTHIRIPPAGTFTDNNIVYAFNDEEDIFNVNVSPSDYKLVLLNSIQKSYIDTFANKVFYANWEQPPSTINNQEVIALTGLNKCHKHDNLPKVCVQD